MSQPPIGSAGETTLSYTEDPSIGSAGQIPAQPFDRKHPVGPPIGSGGETQPHYTTDPSIGSAGVIPGQPRGRDFPDAPPIGSGGAVATEEWNPNVGTANEGDEKKHGFIYNLFHKK